MSFEPDPAAETGAEHLVDNEARLLARVQRLELRVRNAEERRRALLHVLGDMNELNRRLARQRKAMLNILLDYEQNRRRLAGQTDRQHNSRRARAGISMRSMRRSCNRYQTNECTLLLQAKSVELHDAGDDAPFVLHSSFY